MGKRYGLGRNFRERERVMDLGLGNEASGEYLRFKPSVNAWYVDGEEVTLKALSIDPKSLKTGWGLIQEGEAPQWAWDDQVGVKGSRPDEGYKRGFSVMVFLQDHGWREWSSNGAGVNKGISAIWPTIHKGMDDNVGHVAGLKYTGSTADTSGKGATRIPTFELVKWLPMPQADDAEPPKQDDDDALFT